MAITIPQGFDVQAPEPAEIKTIQPTADARNSISLATRYEGMKVYVVDIQKNFQLVGGLTNDFWVQTGDGIDAGSFYTKLDLQTSGEAQVHYDNLTNVPADFTPKSHGNEAHDVNFIVQSDAVIPNVAIVGATKTKITYDAKGLVTSGADATTADIADSTDKRYMTDARITKLDGIAAGAEVNVQADWTASTGDSFIQNKPVLGNSSSKDVGTVAGTVAAGDHNHLGVYEPADSTILKDADIGVSVQAYDADIVIDAMYVHTDNNFTTAEQSKLSGIQAGAEVNVQADWSAVSGDSFIQNKPTIPSQYTDEQAQDAVGNILNNTGNVQFIYDDATPKITANVDLSLMHIQNTDYTIEKVGTYVITPSPSGAGNTNFHTFAFKASLTGTLNSITVSFYADAINNVSDIVLDVFDREFTNSGESIGVWTNTLLSSPYNRTTSITATSTTTNKLITFSTPLNLIKDQIYTFVIYRGTGTGNTSTKGSLNIQKTSATFSAINRYISITYTTVSTELNTLISFTQQGVTSSVITSAPGVDITGEYLKYNGVDIGTASNVLKLDQTTPQTISNGLPIWNSLTASQLTATDASKKLQSLSVSTYPSLTELSYGKGVTSAIQTQLDSKLPLQAITDTKGLTGFIDGSNIDISYNYTNRTITLTGTLTYYWRGQIKTLTSPWTSSAHTNTVGNWFLYSTDGNTFNWANTPWAFEDVMVAYVRRGATAAESFAIRETHGLMDYETHNELHSQIGTYKVSGGILTAGTYVVNTATDAANTPGFDASVVKDEDLITAVNSWFEGTYTTAYVGPSSILVFDSTKTRPFNDAGANTYLQVNDPITGTMTAGVNLRFYNVYQVIVPVCSDVDSQKYRVIMLQPQVTYTSLVAAQAEDVRGLNLGNFANIFTEFVIHARITYITRVGDNNAGKCRIETGGVTYITGSKAGQVSVAGFITNNHAALSNLTWLNSGHIGGADKVAGFDASGLATELGPYLPLTGGFLTGPVYTSKAGGNEIQLDASGTNPTINSFDRLGGVSVPLEFIASSYNFKSGSVGIGTASPAAKLDIFGASSGVESEVIRLNRGDAYRFNSIVSFSQNSELAYMGFNVHDGVTDTSQVRVMTLKGSGNVGIGTSSITSKLQVVGLPSYTDNAAAVSGGLTTGAFYHTSGVVKVVT